MPYAGHQLMAREIAAEGKRYWSNYDLTKFTAMSLGESRGYLGAWHDNAAPVPGKPKPVRPGEEPPPPGTVSRDCGLTQENIPLAAIGTPVEDALRTESLDPDVYVPVLHANVDAAWEKYNQPWVRGGGFDKRRWQAWVAYTSGWALFPEFWVWAQDANGVPVGQWEKTGRYVQNAIAGQMNFHVVILKDWKVSDALHYGAKYADHFQVKAPLISKSSSAGEIVAWQIPPKPTAPPADGIGPRPVPNDGV